MTAPTSKPCPFCHLDANRIMAEDDLTVVYRDGFPVSLGHSVIIPRRHFATLFDATEAEQAALLRHWRTPGTSSTSTISRTATT